MDRARTIFSDIRARGGSAVEELFAQKQSENLFLDFKTTNFRGQDPTITDEDKKNFSKAIAGFGNSSGGVLIWGVNTGCGSSDFATSRRVIPNVAGFVSHLNTLSGSRTIPSHGLVENEVVYEQPNGEGLAASLVPEAPQKPLQAVVDEKFYIRTGSTFSQAPYGALAAFFGARPEGEIDLETRIETVLHKSDNKIEIIFFIDFQILCPTICRDIYFVCDIEQMPGPKWSMVTKKNEMWELSSIKDSHFSWILRDGLRFPPFARVSTPSVRIISVPPNDKPLKFQITTGGDGLRRNIFDFEERDSSIQNLALAAHQELRAKSPSDRQPLTFTEFSDIVLFDIHKRI